MAGATFDVWGIVRRNWWIVVLATLAGAVVAVAATAGAKTAYSGKTYLGLNAIVISTYPQLPRQDEIIAASADKTFRDAVAKRMGIPTDQLGTLRVYSTGNPQNKLWVTYTSPDKALAEKGAKAVAEQVLIAFKEAGDPLFAQLNDSVKADEAALAALGDPKDQVGVFNAWSVKRTLISDRETLKFVESALTYGAPVTVAATSKRNAAMTSAAGGALAGLFLGIALVAVRETLSRRRGSTASA